MRILFISDAYIPVPCGVAVSVESLRVSLEKRGHKVFIIAPSYRNWKDSSPRVARLNAIFHPTEAYRPYIWPTSSVSRKKIQSLKIDIVHSHFHFNNFDLPYRIARAANTPLINTVYRIFPEHSRISPPPLSSKNASFEKSLKKMIAYQNNCDRIIALSKMSKKYLLKYNVTPEIDVVPIGIFSGDFASFPPETVKEKLKIPLKRKLVLFVGDVSDENNVRLLFRSFKKVWHAIEDVHLLVVGTGKLFHDMKHALAREQFAKFVTFTGYLPKKQLNKIFGACDILAYPGRLDPQPLVIIESLASGTPVVAVEGMGSQDFIKDNVDGFVSKPTVEDFSDKMIELLRRDNLRMQFSQKARMEAREFRSSILTSDLLHSYEKAIEKFKDKII
ncbi:MAG: Alpha-monoglucosyldiacylglycerol synthase [candidate division WS2 bacterium ADurb.Bin280]|uniref:Alpha-monoglucosyldiacylglycerol synthase n=1 Tax=candidate division WS2 bacterium ADurb.Bin280 TaxID=1852829 RepID=A0A1V5SFI2_9BACT|nr:MAG: Alpha-monoglucosyldiacylglycerol synthase [candidate division WS2 bacterium ADurb.Bin280]